MACLREKYVWEVPVRVTHWLNFLSIIILSATGIFIGEAKTFTRLPSEYLMGWVRFIHFVGAYVFTISVLIRLYWSFVGNEYAHWRVFFPYLTAKGRRNMLDTFRYYLFFSKKGPHVVGHNALAATTYSIVLLLYFVMIISGFALYAQNAPGGFMHTVGSLTFRIVSPQGMRLTHHIVMWLLIAFAIHHVYSAWLMDIKERGGVMSSIFGGYKAVQTKEHS